MVAIIILTGMIFFTVTTRPQIPSGTGGLDLNALAQDTLEYFDQTVLADPQDATLNLTMEQWIGVLVNGSTEGKDVADAIEAQLDLILPTGVEGALLLHNGHGSLVLAPDLGGTGLGGRGGAVGQSYFVPNWTAHGDAAGTAVLPGGSYDFSPYACLVAPTGQSTAPQQTTWIADWTAQEPGLDTVPENALFGVWEAHVLAGCNDVSPVTFQVVRSEGAATPLSAYSIQLVVWALA